MKRNTFKKGYMILHTAVAVSIVLIGIKVLIGFGQSTYDGAKIVKDKASYQFYKLEDKWQDSKKKKKSIKAMKKQIAFAERLAKSSCHTNAKYHLTLETEKRCIIQRLNNMNNLEAVWYHDAKNYLSKIKSNQLKKWNR